MRNKLKRGWHRREWDCNPADPTTGVSWKFGSRWLEIELIGIWGVESKITVGRYTVRGYDAFWAVQVFDWLESKFQFEQFQHGESEAAAAERAAGWDPNP